MGSHRVIVQSTLKISYACIVFKTMQTNVRFYFCSVASQFSDTLIPDFSKH